MKFFISYDGSITPALQTEKPRILLGQIFYSYLVDYLCAGYLLAVLGHSPITVENPRNLEVDNSNFTWEN